MSNTPNPNLPFYGATREAVVAQGLDPDLVEAGRLAAAEGRQQQAIENETEITARALEAVQEGELTWAEAATALSTAGYANAHAVVVQQWRAEEAEYGAEAAAYDISMMDAEEYAQHFAERQARERDQLAASAREAARQLEAAKLQALIGKFQEFTTTVPGAHSVADAVERRVVDKIRTDGIPATEGEQGKMIESALREEVVLSDAAESIRQQVDAEYRIQRRMSGKSDGLMTAADIAAAEAHYKTVRTQQLLAEKQIDTEAMKPQPTAAEQSAALAGKYRAKNEASDEFHRHVKDIREAGQKGTTLGGESFTDQKRAYKEAYARAEAEAGFGSSEGVKTAYGPEATAGAKPGGYGPDGTWPDELGPVL